MKTPLEALHAWAHLAYPPTHWLIPHAILLPENKLTSQACLFSLPLYLSQSIWDTKEVLIVWMNEIPVTTCQTTLKDILSGARLSHSVCLFVCLRSVACLASICKSEVNDWEWRRVFSENILRDAGLDNSKLHYSGSSIFIMTTWFTEKKLNDIFYFLFKVVEVLK